MKLLFSREDRLDCPCMNGRDLKKTIPGIVGQVTAFLSGRLCPAAVREAIRARFRVRKGWPVQ
jgi:hypothetical protein